MPFPLFIFPISTRKIATPNAASADAQVTEVSQRDSSRRLLWISYQVATANYPVLTRLQPIRGVAARSSTIVFISIDNDAKPIFSYD